MGRAYASGSQEALCVSELRKQCVGEVYIVGESGYMRQLSPRK